MTEVESKLSGNGLRKIDTETGKANLQNENEEKDTEVMTERVSNLKEGEVIEEYKNGKIKLKTK